MEGFDGESAMVVWLLMDMVLSWVKVGEWMWKNNARLVGVSDELG